MTNHRVRGALVLAVLGTACWGVGRLAAEDLEKSVAEARRDFDLTAHTDRGSVSLSKEQDALRRYIQSEWGSNWDPRWEREAGKGAPQPKAKVNVVPEPPSPPRSLGPDKRRFKDAAQGFLGIAKYLAPPAIGAAGGGLVGAAIAGTPGAVAGATIGSIGGAAVTVGMIVWEIAKAIMDSF